MLFYLPFMVINIRNEKKKKMRVRKKEIISSKLREETEVLPKDTPPQ